MSFAQRLGGLPDDVQRRVYAHLNERHERQLRGLARTGDEAARLRLRELSRERARRSARRRARRGLVRLASNPPGNRSHENPEQWTRNVENGHERRLHIALMTAKLLPAMVVAARFMHNYFLVPLRYRHRIRVHHELDDVIVIEDTASHAKVQVERQENGRYVLEAVTLQIRAPRRGLAHANRTADVIVFYRGPQQPAWDGLIDVSNQGPLNAYEFHVPTSPLHRDLEIAGRLALRRAEQIMQQNFVQQDAIRPRNVARILGSRRF